MYRGQGRAGEGIFEWGGEGGGGKRREEEGGGDEGFEVLRVVKRLNSRDLKWYHGGMVFYILDYIRSKFSRFLYQLC